jgi:hypothetical protein
LSKRTTGQVMDDLFDVSMRVGTISQWEQSPTEGFAPPVAEARDCGEEQPVAHLDETSGRQRSIR